MSKISQQFPSTRKLSGILTELFKENNSSIKSFKIINRRQNIYMSSYPSEIVECLLPNNRRLKLLCKYNAEWQEDEYSHRRNIIYEGEVYKNILQKMNLSKIKFYGLRNNGDNHVIVLKYLVHGKRIDLTSQAEVGVIQKAAQWIGMFHYFNEQNVKENNLSFLIIYSYEDYSGCVERTLEFTKGITFKKRYPWLKTLCENFKIQLKEISSIPATIIHGEYYPHNILYYRGRIYPLDWQSAAIAFGEIDLASLIEGWSDRVVSECKEEYKRARWPDGVPNDFEKVFLYAQMYLQFRWLGHKFSWIKSKRMEQKFELLYQGAKKLKFI